MMADAPQAEFLLQGTSRSPTSSIRRAVVGGVETAERTYQSQPPFVALQNRRDRTLIEVRSDGSTGLVREKISRASEYRLFYNFFSQIFLTKRSVWLHKYVYISF